MVFAVSSALGLSRLSSIKDNRDYLQNRIIFKNGGVASSAINEGV
jgi:hypothetical protein